MELLFYHSALQPDLGGDKGIPIVHMIDCCIILSACTISPSKRTTDLLDCISGSWIDVFGNMKVLTLDGETGMKGKDVDDWAMYSQTTMRYKAPHQKAWLVERHNALIRNALQKAESQVIKESLCITSGRC